MGAQVIFESLTFTPVRVTNNKGNIVAGIFQKADTRNANGRVYRRSLWEKVLRRSDIKRSIDDRTMLGELGHPEIVETTPLNVSHIITKLELRPNGDVYGEAEILDTPSGRVLKTLYEAGVKMGISSRGYLPEGSCLMPESNGDLVVPDDFELVTFDFVLVPSTPGANPTLKEGELKKLSSIISESRTKLNSDVVSYIEGVVSSNPSGMKVLHEAKVLEPSDSDKGTETPRILYKEGVMVKEQTAYIGTLEKIVSDLTARYKVAESVIEDLLEERKSSADVLDDLVKRYLTAEAIIVEFTNYSLKLEEALAEVTQLQNVSEGVIENLRSRYTLSEGVIKEFLARHTLSEQEISDLKKQIEELTSSSDSVTNEATSALESANAELKKINNLSEGVIRELSAKVKALETPKEEPATAEYFEDVSRRFNIAVGEAKKIFSDIGSNKTAFEYHLAEKKRLATNAYSEFPYMKGAQSQVNEGAIPGTVSKEDDKLVRLVASQFK